MELSNILKSLRVENGFTQKELAKELNIGQSTVNGYEKGNREPIPEIIKAYALFFDVSTDYILGVEENESLIKENRCNNVSLTKEEKKLLEQFRCLGKAERHAVALSCETFYKNSEKNGTIKNYKKNNL